MKYLIGENVNNKPFANCLLSMKQKQVNLFLLD
nr:MAG TPA: hypothetical protein [Bacteriophage sp.]